MEATIILVLRPYMANPQPCAAANEYFTPNGTYVDESLDCLHVRT